MSFSKVTALVAGAFPWEASEWRAPAHFYFVLNDTGVGNDYHQFQQLCPDGAEQPF